MKATPKHIAIIPDGNRRWAKERGLPTIEGHRRGFQNAVALAKRSRELGISIFTLWAFSTENWTRSSEETGYLMKLYEQLLDQNLKEALSDSVRIIQIGRRDRIPKSLLLKIEKAEAETKHFTTHKLIIAVDYGGRDEILRGIKKLEIGLDSLTEEDFEKQLDTAGLPDPDVIIRTGREMRLSGFLPWQGAYSELFFPDFYFPDFTPTELEKVLDEYATRQRRFGK